MHLVPLDGMLYLVPVMLVVAGYDTLLELQFPENVTSPWLFLQRTLLRLYIADSQYSSTCHMAFLPGTLCVVPRILVSYDIYNPVAPVAYQVFLEPGIGQFREFESVII